MPRSSLRPATATRAPAPASASAIAPPRTPVPPSTTAVSADRSNRLPLMVSPTKSGFRCRSYRFPVTFREMLCSHALKHLQVAVAHLGGDLEADVDQLPEDAD